MPDTGTAEEASPLREEILKECTASNLDLDLDLDSIGLDPDSIRYR
jgi:hypothetical protein